MKFTLTILIIFVFTTNLYSQECDETTIARMIKSGISDKTIEEQCGKIGENGKALVKPKTKEESRKKIVVFLEGLFTPEEPESQREVAERVTNDFLQVLRDELKKQGLEPCDTCYTMMEPNDPRIPEGYCVSLTGCPEGETNNGYNK
jgi:hypothetical protein|tara:strand:- start:23 stop:463 length:441 start_codon:yes stop_codon:yes gene_type:complete